MAEKGTDSRLKLTITEVGEIAEVGQNKIPKLSFKAKEKDGGDLPYFTFSKRLFDYIKPGEIDCDVNVSQRQWDRDGDVQTFTDRKVFQIYVDGQPVVGKRQGGYGDSPEKIASIEAQSAVKDVMDSYTKLLIADASIPAGLEKLWEHSLSWCSDKILSLSTRPPATKPPAPKTAKKPEPIEEIFSEEQSQGQTVEGDLKNLPIRNLQDLFTACYHHFKMNQTDVLKELGGIAKEQIADPQESWQQIVEARS